MFQNKIIQKLLNFTRNFQTFRRISFEVSKVSNFANRESVRSFEFDLIYLSPTKVSAIEKIWRKISVEEIFEREKSFTPRSLHRQLAHKLFADTNSKTSPTQTLSQTQKLSNFKFILTTNFRHQHKLSSAPNFHRHKSFSSRIFLGLKLSSRNKFPSTNLSPTQIFLVVNIFSGANFSSIQTFRSEINFSSSKLSRT